jgi:urease accessory protein UreF
MSEKQRDVLRGQRLLHRLIARMPLLVESAALLSDAELSTSNAALMLGSALHESQYSRLFRC